MKRAQTGFTLVEIAIVLVIIGLLLGGILKGQEMITQAKIKNGRVDDGLIATRTVRGQKHTGGPNPDINAAADASGYAENGTNVCTLCRALLVRRSCC